MEERNILLVQIILKYKEKSADIKYVSRHAEYIIFFEIQYLFEIDNDRL